MTHDFAVWRRLTTTYRGDVFCGLFVEEGNQGLASGPDVLRALGQRNLVLELDILPRCREGEPFS